METRQRWKTFAGIAGVLALACIVGIYLNGAMPASPHLVEQAMAEATTPPVKNPASPPPPAAPAGTSQMALGSKPAEKDGLSIVIQPVNVTVVPGQNLAVMATYRNTSKQPFRFPSGGSGLSSVLFILEDVNTGKIYTGGDDRFENGAPRIRNATGKAPKPTDPPMAGPAPALQPGESRDVRISALGSTGFYVGQWNDFAAFSAARSVLSSGPAGMPRLDGGFAIGFYPGTILTAPAQIPFPPGTYTLSVNIEFPVGDQPGAQADPTPLWKGLSIRSNTVDIKIVGVSADYVPIALDHEQQPLKTGWISGVALDTQGNPAAKAGLIYYSVMDLKTAPKAVKAGTTDDTGHFIIKDLPPGRYMVIAGNPAISGVRYYPGDPPRISGSLQPIEVKEGQQAKLADPIKMVPPRIGGAGGIMHE